VEAFLIKRSRYASGRYAGMRGAVPAGTDVEAGGLAAREFGSNSQEEHEKSRSTHAFDLEIPGYVIDCVLVILGDEVLIWDD
jgi:hypothetical protein